MVLSPILCLLAPGAALLPVSTAVKGGVAGGLLVVAEVIFWLGALLAGPEVARRFRWRRQRVARTERIRALAHESGGYTTEFRDEPEIS